MHSFEILQPTGIEGARWHHFAQRAPGHVRDVMFTPAYYRAQRPLGGQPMAALYTWDDSFVLQPFLMRSIPGSDLFDMTSPYGFGGPVSNLNSSGGAGPLWAYFDEEFTKWRRQVGVVSEYCVLSPCGFQHQDKLLTGSGIEITGEREVAIIRLDQSDDYLLKDAHESRRQLVGRAQREGVQISRLAPPDPWINTVWKLYTAAMLRKGAAQRWLFPVEYFQAALDLMPEHAFMLAAGRHESISQVCLVLLGGQTAHYHLAARAEDTPPGAGELMVLEACRMARRAGAIWLNLGGGLTGAADDRLWGYKASWTPHRAPVRSYRRIFDQDAYTRLCANLSIPHEAQRKWFPGYRVLESI